MAENSALDIRWGAFSRMHDPYLLANIETRPTDILITTAPKAGTTWMQQILYQIISGGDDTFSSIYDVVPWLERPQENKTRDEVLQEYAVIKNPRIFKTHCTYTQTPGHSDVRIILSSRDPRDCCVSFYHHVMDMTDEARALAGLSVPASFADYFRYWMDFGAWFRNIKSWWPHRNDSNVLWLRYQDMKQDLEGAVDQILVFLDHQLQAGQRERVLEYSSFSWMKNNAERFTRFSNSAESNFMPGGFIRKGQVGDYHNLLSPEQEEQILKMAEAELEPQCLDFLELKRA